MKSTAKVVLAYSGGLDTTYCLHNLIQQGFEVHTAFINTGGITPQEKNSIKDKALAIGCYQHHQIEAQQMVWQQFVIPLIWSQARMRNEYPLLCSDRYVIVAKCLELCDKLDTHHFAHGCTAMGNDQLRFDQTVNALGNYQIHAPVRDLQDTVAHVRNHEIKTLKDAGIDVDISHKKYSINHNMLGVTISGGSIDAFKTPNNDSYVISKPIKDWPSQPLAINIEFAHGIPIKLNGVDISGPDLLMQLNQSLGAYGIGRHIYTGDVSIGLKGRIVFECPAIDALFTAHQALEDCINSQWQIAFRQTLSDRWAELLYRGFYHDPHKNDIESYFKSSQSHVSGVVELVTEGSTIHATSITSPWIVREKQAIYAQTAPWSAADAAGFIRLSGQSSTQVNKIRQPHVGAAS